MTYARGSRPVLLKNIDAEDMPAFACGYIETATEYQNDILLHVRRPTTAAEASEGSYKFVFNSGTTIKAGMNGHGNKAMCILGLCVADAEGAVGPVEDEWYLDAGNTQFGVVSDDPTAAYDDGTISSKLVEVSGNAGIALAIAYTTAGVTARSGTTVGTGTARIKKLVSNVITDLSPTLDVTVKNMSTTAVASAKYIQLKKESYSGIWIVDWEQC